MLKHLLWTECASSTNDLIKKYPANSVLIAGIQTKGRGRQGRDWLSVKGGLYFTYKKPLNCFLENLQGGFCAITIGAACHKALTMPNKPVQKLYLKWPNDLLNDQLEKIAGILIEVSQQNYLIGIGLNCGSNPEFANYQSLYSNLYLAKLIINQIDLFAQKPKTEIIEYWEKHTHHKKNTQIKAHLPNGSLIEGKFKFLGQNGELWLETTADNKLISLESGILQD